MLGFFSSLEENPNRFSGIIPVTLSLDMDGFGGAVIGNLFKINEEILPKGYKFNTNGVGRQLGFLVKGFNHALSNNDWITTIDAYPFIIPSNEEIKLNNQFWITFIEKGLDITLITPPGTPPPAGKPPAPGSKFKILPFKQTALYNDPAFRAKVKAIADKYKLNDEDILKICYKESAGHNPQAALYYKEKNNPNPGPLQVNDPRPGYYLFGGGLFGFTQIVVPTTGAGSLENIVNADALTQLDYYEKLLASYKKQITGANLAALYMNNFLPVLVKDVKAGKMDTILQAPGLSAYAISSQNSGIATAAGKKPGDALTVADWYKYIDTLFKL
jgi:hypothetical protein